MKKKARETGRCEPADWVICLDGVQFLLSRTHRAVKDEIAERLRIFSQKVADLTSNVQAAEQTKQQTAEQTKQQAAEQTKKQTEKQSDEETDEQGYRLINGYRVREIFAGEESLTSLLTRYVQRTVALNY